MEAAPVALVACALAAFSFIDDLKGLPVAARLIGHFMAAALGVWLLPHGVTVFQNLLPLDLDRVAATLLLVWFINLYNFMDGID
ncbi:MAG: glycosyl transferase, partial [Stellaceae bacterium]